MPSDGRGVPAQPKRASAEQYRVVAPQPHSSSTNSSLLWGSGGGALCKEGEKGEQQAGGGDVCMIGALSVEAWGEGGGGRWGGGVNNKQIERKNGRKKTTTKGNRQGQKKKFTYQPIVHAFSFFRAFFVCTLFTTTPPASWWPSPHRASDKHIGGKGGQKP